MQKRINNHIDFEVSSKKSFIGFVIKLIVFLLFLNVFVNYLLSSSKSKGVLFIVLALIFSSYLTYNFIFEKTVLKIKSNRLKIFYTKGIPKRNYQFEYELDNVGKIILKQTHDLLYGTKFIYLSFKDNTDKTIVVNLRYYQLVKLQDYLQSNFNFEVRLIG